MTFALTYATGTISVANGATSVTGSGVTWTAIREGDSLIDPATGARGIIASIEDTSGALTLLDPWPGTSLTDDAYRIVYDSPARRSGVVVSAAIEELVAAQTILLARRADYLVQDALLDTPPGSPTAGDVYLVGTSPSGAWSGKGGYLATWTDAAAWSFTAPETGMRVVDVSVDPPAFYFRGASAWSIEAVPNSGVSAGTYGSGTAVAVVTVGADGRITGAEEVAIEVPASGVAADTYGSATEIPVVTVGADGRITDVSTAPAAGVRTHTIMANQMQASLGSATAGTINVAGSGQKFASLEFDASTAENGRFFLPMPAAWDLGAVDVRIGWAPADGNAGNVLWNLRASTIMADDSSNTMALDWGGSFNVLSAAPGAANEMQVASFANVTPSGTPAAGAFLSFLLTRVATDGTDTYAADARLLWVQILYGVTSNSDA